MWVLSPGLLPLQNLNLRYESGPSLQLTQSSAGARLDLRDVVEVRVDEVRVCAVLRLTDVALHERVGLAVMLPARVPTQKFVEEVDVGADFNAQQSELLVVFVAGA